MTTSLPTFPPSLPPRRVFTRLLNVRSTCLVRSHSRCTENTAAPSHSFSWENTFLRASCSRQFHAFFPPCCDPNRLRTNGLRVRGTNNATHYDLSLRDFYEISLLSSRWSTSPQVFRNKKKKKKKKGKKRKEREKRDDFLVKISLRWCFFTAYFRAQSPFEQPSALNTAINQRNGKLRLV